MLYNTTAPHTSSQNGIAEQLNQTLLDHAHVMLFNSRLPKFLWTYAVAYACYLRNRSPTCALDGKTPYEMFFNSKLNIGMIHTFSSDIWVLDQGQIGKLDPHSNKFKFIGLMDNTRTYHYYKPDSGNIAKSRNVIFLHSTPEYNIQTPGPSPPEGESQPHVQADKPTEDRVEFMPDNSFDDSVEDLNSSANNDPHCEGFLGIRTRRQLREANSPLVQIRTDHGPVRTKKQTSPNARTLIAIEPDKPV